MNDIPPPVACLLNLDNVRKLYEAAWRDGFRNGADHGNLDYKYPPEDIAWLEHKKRKTDLYICLSRDELKAISRWEDASYEARTKGAQWLLDPEEQQEAAQ